MDAETGNRWLDYTELGADRKPLRKRLPLLHRSCWGFVDINLNSTLARQVPYIANAGDNSPDKGFRLAHSQKSFIRVTLDPKDIFVCGRLIPPNEPLVAHWRQLGEKTSKDGHTLVLTLPETRRDQLDVNFDKHGHCGYRIGMVVRDEQGQAYWRVSARTFDFVTISHFDRSVLSMNNQHEEGDVVVNRPEDEEESIYSSTNSSANSSRGQGERKLRNQSSAMSHSRSGSNDDGTGSDSGTSQPEASTPGQLLEGGGNQNLAAGRSRTGPPIPGKASITPTPTPGRADSSQSSSTTRLHPACSLVCDMIESATTLYHPSRTGRVAVGATTELCLLVGHGPKAKRSAARVKISTQTDLLVVLSSAFPPPDSVLLVTPNQSAVFLLIQSPSHVKARVQSLDTSQVWTGVYRFTANADNKFPFATSEHGMHGYKVALRFNSDSLLPCVRKSLTPAKQVTLSRPEQLLADSSLWHTSNPVVDVVLHSTRIHLKPIERVRSRKRMQPATKIDTHARPVDASVFASSSQATSSMPPMSNADNFPDIELEQQPFRRSVRAKRRGGHKRTGRPVAKLASIRPPSPLLPEDE
eukprot:TRINITY_DN9290_c0_g1_i1.p1 TRINITY_DN9290_c0_g1~~TRINITY_DN9290_c0_g1_i1.p1  ORF type:complete len:658 (+),score=108.65 TRINITY_DN9290_c0_g1_i1:227-1975(+)